MGESVDSERKSLNVINSLPPIHLRFLNVTVEMFESIIKSYDWVA